MRPTIKEVKEVTKKPAGTGSFIVQFIYRFFSVRISKYLVRTRLTPNQITIISRIEKVCAEILSNSH